jgi:hypothetical protein
LFTPFASKASARAKPFSNKTAKSWLSILETCYLVHFVRPHFASFGKRLIKAPKLYMTDVGLAAALLGIQTAQQMAAIEMKSGPSVASDAFGHLKKWHKYATERGHYSAIHLGLVYGGDTRYAREGVDLMPWADLA